MTGAGTLIRTKMHPPFTRQELVARPHLQQKLIAGLQGPLTLVIAPAGFGKTTLVSSTLDSCEMPVAWLSLDTEDNREGRFLTYLIAALQTVDSNTGVEAAQLLAGIQQASPEAILTSLVNDLDASEMALALVLDDYHVINNPAIYEAVAFLLEHRPPTFHLVIATRSDPPLPLARLRARSQVTELRAADLRFTVHEAARFLNDVMDLRLDAAAVAVLEERTEGWITGLQMAALSMRDRKDLPGFITGFSGTNRYILDYLLEEVLAGQPQEVQHFLLRTSILERLSASLCNALLEGCEFENDEDDNNTSSPSDACSAALLEYLQHENLFLVSLDDEHTWFRYHHLLIDLLRSRLQQSHPELVPRLHGKAADWLEKKGYIAEAIRHLLAAHEENRSMQLIEHYGPLRWAENDLSVMRMADDLPFETLLSHPKTGIYHIWLLINRGDIKNALPLLHGLEQQIASQKYPPGEEWINIIVRLALSFLNRPSGNEVEKFFSYEQMLEDIPETEPIMQDTAEILYAMTLGRLGEDERAADFSVRCLQKTKSPPPALVIPSLVSFLASTYWALGRMNEAASLCRRHLASIHEKKLRIFAAGNLDIILGEALYEANLLDDAEEHIRRGLKANEPWNNIMTDAFGLIALVHVLDAQGDGMGAMQTVDRFERRLQAELRPVEFREDFHTLRVRLQLERGEIEQAARWAQQVTFHEDYHYCPDWFQPTLARICLAQGRFGEAAEILAQVNCARLAGNRTVRSIEIHLLQAIALTGQQHNEQALAQVVSALALGSPEGYMRAFLDMKEPARELLAACLRTPGHAHEVYIRKLLNAFLPADTIKETAVQQNGLLEPLTERELEVLQLMALGMTNQQIAEQLVVARGTIKAHAASIYRKLDADNRTEAVAHARNMGILS